MDKIFLAGDGDGAGQLVGQAVLHDDFESLAAISQKLQAGLGVIQEWVESNGGQIISAGGDEFTAMFDGIQSEEDFINSVEDLREAYLQATDATITIGVGTSLSQSGKALLEGKLSGKDQINVYSQDTDDMLQSAHEHVTSGEGSDEEQKLDDHYIGSLQDEEDDSDLEDDMQENSMVMDDEDDGDFEEYEDDDLSEDDQDLEYSDEEGQMEDQPNEEIPDQQSNFSEEDPEYPQNPEEGEESEEMTDEEMLENNSLLQDTNGDGEINEEDQMEDQPQQEESFQEEEPIEIPESEEMQTKPDDELETMKDEEPQQEEMTEDVQSPDLFNEMVDDSQGQEQTEELKQMCAQTLASFKEQKQNLDAIKEQAPELYQSVLGMLQCMIEMSKQLFPEQSEQEVPQEEPVDPKM